MLPPECRAFWLLVCALSRGREKQPNTRVEARLACGNATKPRRVAIAGHGCSPAVDCDPETDQWCTAGKRRRPLSQPIQSPVAE